MWIKTQFGTPLNLAVARTIEVQECYGVFGVCADFGDNKIEVIQGFDSNNDAIIFREKLFKKLVGEPEYFKGTSSSTSDKFIQDQLQAMAEQGVFDAVRR